MDYLKIKLTVFKKVDVIKEQIKINPITIVAAVSATTLYVKDLFSNRGSSGKFISSILN